MRGSTGAPRLHAILARASTKAVVFRRGPTKQVRLIAWDRNGDRFEPGQWLKGRIYERRCDLSPNGKYLVYFAASWMGPYGTWTAVSRPPYLTALALWAKGDAWGGGGLWEHDRRLALNHRGYQRTLTKGRVDGRIEVVPLGEYAGGGEDYPIYDMRRAREGWSPPSETTRTENRFGEELWIEYDPPERRTKPSPKGAGLLEVALRGIKQRDGPWYAQSHRVIEGESTRVDLGDSDWADWDRNGDLLYAKDGRLWRLRAGDAPGNEKLLADFRDDEFCEVSPPEWATRWKG